MSLEFSTIESATNFGKWLKEQRVGLGISIREAAGRSGMNVQRLVLIETGSTETSVNHIEASMICRTYRITTDEFLQKAKGE